MDRGCIKSFERRCCGSEGLLVGIERIFARVSVAGENKAISTGKGYNQCVDRYRCACKGHRVEIMATEHQ